MRKKQSVKMILTERRGSSLFWMPFLVLGLFIFGTVFWEYSRINIIGLGVRDAVQTAITQVCTDNYDKVYNGVREGYSGGYKLDSMSWAENVDTSNIMALVDKKLGSHDGTKSTTGKTEFAITNLQIQIQNSPLAPSDSTQQFTGTATYHLIVPLSFGWQNLPPITVDVEAKGGYSPHGELSGDSGSGGDGVPVSGVSLSDSSMIIMKGDYASLSATVQPEDASNPAVSWISSDDSIVSVDQSGLVHGINTGTASVTALAQGGIAQCQIRVITPVDAIKLNKSILTLQKGASETLVATVTPDNASDKSLWWTTSDPNICTVDASGKLTGINPGTAEVIVASQASGAMDRCVVTVEIPVNGITLNKSQLTLDKGASEALIATVHPEDAVHKDVLWASANPSIASVDQNGMVTAVDSGLTIITATTSDGQYIAQCNVTVFVHVTGILLDKTNLTLNKGSSETLIATILPINATDKGVIWSSLNPLIASVDSSGKVTGNNSGSTLIYATSHDGGIQATCAIVIRSSTYTVSANAENGSVTGAGEYQAGSNVTLTAYPNFNYDFANWTNPSGNVVSTSSQFTIYNLQSNVTVTANFKSIYTDESLFEIRDNYDGTCAVIGFKKDAKYETVRIPPYIKGKKVTSLAPKIIAQGTYGLFYQNDYVKNVIAPDTVTALEDKTFKNIKISAVTLPNTVTSIGVACFYQSSLMTINIPHSVTSIGAAAFAYTKIKSINLPDSITVINASTFTNTLLTSVDIPNSVSSIGDYAFAGYSFGFSPLQSVHIPNSVKTIGEGAFEFNPITTIDIPNSVTSIGDDAFFNTQLTSVSIPGSVTKIGSSAFSQCTNLMSIVMQNSANGQPVTVGDGAFRDCPSLSSVALSNSVVSIGEYTFYGCKALPSIVIPSKVASIGSHAFHECSSLGSINIPRSVVTVGQFPFSGLNALTVTVQGRTAAEATALWGDWWYTPAKIIYNK